MIKLLSSDHILVDWPDVVINRNLTILKMINDIEIVDQPIEIRITAEILLKIKEFDLQFGKYNGTTLSFSDWNKQWTRNFFDISDSLLNELITAANYLCNELLLNTACRQVAHIIDELANPELVRTRFKLPHDDARVANI